MPTRTNSIPHLTHLTADTAAHAGHPDRASRRAALAQLGAAALVMASSTRAQAAEDPNVVTLDAARAAHEGGKAVLIDIREPVEHANGVAAGAVLLPMRQLASRLGEIPTDPAKPVYLICNSQNRSSAVLRALRERGYEHVRYVHGGMSEWARRGWPMVKPAG